MVQPAAGRLWSLRMSRCSAALTPEVGGLDPQRRIVADHGGRAEVGLADGHADDAVVRHRGVEAVLDEQVPADVVDLDLEGSRAVAGRYRGGERPPWRTRSSSRVRSAVRTARPTSSGRVLSPSSSSTTVSGTTTSPSSNSSTHVGSAINTEVSSTRRIRCSVAVGGAELPSSVTEPFDPARRSSDGLPVDGRRSVDVTPEWALVGAGTCSACRLDDWRLNAGRAGHCCSGRSRPVVDAGVNGS